MVKKNAIFLPFQVVKTARIGCLHARKYPKLDLEYVSTDSGCELPETYEYLGLNKGCAKYRYYSDKARKGL